ncbi:MAG: hypothetical protein LBP36_02570 [Oscillospiraceae bacterium]|nr:hypothetical protein [Oscillospiraceae bacterium]
MRRVDQDLNFVIGGAAVNPEVGTQHRLMAGSQVCNIASFKPQVSGVNLAICDNCVHSRALYEGAAVVCCLKQPSLD